MGFTMTFDTTNLLLKVEGEVLTHEELELISVNFKKVSILSKLIRIPLGDDDYCFIYKL